jgi:hypothetical protein
MDTNFINALKNRKASIEKELDHINGLLVIYTNDGVVENTMVVADASPKLKVKPKAKPKSKRSSPIKDQIISIINSLGGKAYVAQVTEEYTKLHPDKDRKAINGTVRNYIHILKSEKVLRDELVDKKYLYHLQE